MESVGRRTVASATNFNTRNDTFRKLMGNGLSYRIPPFQRDYSWTEEEWEDRWLDIVGTVKDGGEPAHYHGVSGAPIRR